MRDYETVSETEFTQGDAHPCDISLAVREQTIEECAKVAESWTGPPPFRKHPCEDIADQLRRLKGEQE